MNNTYTAYLKAFKIQQTYWCIECRHSFLEQHQPLQYCHFKRKCKRQDCLVRDEIKRRPKHPKSSRYVSKEKAWIGEKWLHKRG